VKIGLQITQFIFYGLYRSLGLSRDKGAEDVQGPLIFGNSPMGEGGNLFVARKIYEKSQKPKLLGVSGKITP